LRRCSAFAVLTAITLWVPAASLTQIAVVFSKVGTRIRAVWEIENISRVIAATAEPAKPVGKLFVIVLAAWIVHSALWADGVLGRHSNTSAVANVVGTGTEAERLAVILIRIVTVLETAVDCTYVVLAVIFYDGHVAADFGVARWVFARVDCFGFDVAAFAFVTDAGHRVEPAEFAHLGVDCHEGAGAQATHQ